MQRISKILFMAESEMDNQQAFVQATTIAQNNQAEITVVGVIENLKTGKATESGLPDLLVKQKLEELQSLVQSVPVDGIPIDLKVLTGSAFIEIIREVIMSQQDLLIKPVESKYGSEHQLFGVTDRKLLRKCPCPVWLFKSKEQQGYREILVGLDYEPDNAENEALNKHLLEIASSLALADGSDLHILHVWEFQHESFLRSSRTGFSDAEVDDMIIEEVNTRKNWLDNFVADYYGKLGAETTNYLNPKTFLIKGDVRKEFPNYVKEKGIELVVMGTVGRTGLPGFVIGNTAEVILNQINCSVLAVKPSGFVSPVTLAE